VADPSNFSPTIEALYEAFPHCFVVVIAISAAKLTQAQQHDWIPQGIEALRQGASSKTEFTLDHSMLVFASKLDRTTKTSAGDCRRQRGLVRRYHFPDAGRTTRRF